MVRPLHCLQGLVAFDHNTDLGIEGGWDLSQVKDVTDHVAVQNFSSFSWRFYV